MTRDTRSGGTPAAAPAPTRHEVLVNLRRALSVLDTVRANHESAARIGTLEALECIDRQDWDDAVDSLIAAARGVEAGALSGVAPEPSEAALDVLRAEVASLREAAQLVVDECLPDQPPSLGSIEKLRGALAPASREPTP